MITVRHDVPVTVDGVSQYAPARSRSALSVCLSVCLFVSVMFVVRNTCNIDDVIVVMTVLVQQLPADHLVVEMLLVAIIGR